MDVKLVELSAFYDYVWDWYTEEQGGWVVDGLTRKMIRKATRIYINSEDMWDGGDTCNIFNSTIGLQYVRFTSQNDILDLFFLNTAYKKPSYFKQLFYPVIMRSLDSDKRAYRLHNF